MIYKVTKDDLRRALSTYFALFLGAECRTCIVTSPGDSSLLIPKFKEHVGDITLTRFEDLSI